jgi:hypothetical protein
VLRRRWDPEAPEHRDSSGLLEMDWRSTTPEDVEAQQKLFLRTAAPERLDFSAKWSGGEPWINPFAKAIFGPVSEAYDSGGTVSVAHMGRIAADCRRLKASRHD